MSSLSKGYDGVNSNVTFGYLILEITNSIKELLLRDNTLDKIQSYEMILDWMDGQLYPYWDKMELKYFDREKSAYIEKALSHEHANKLIRRKLAETEPVLNDKMMRVQYVYWLNRWAQLLASCYEHINLMPERKATEQTWEEEEEISQGSAEIPGVEEESVGDWDDTPEEAEVDLIGLDSGANTE